MLRGVVVLEHRLALGHAVRLRRLPPKQGCAKEDGCDDQARADAEHQGVVVVEHQLESVAETAAKPQKGNPQLIPLSTQRLTQAERRGGE